VPPASAGAALRGRGPERATKTLFPTASAFGGSGSTALEREGVNWVCSYSASLLEHRFEHEQRAGPFFSDARHSPRLGRTPRNSTRKSAPPGSHPPISLERRPTGSVTAKMGRSAHASVRTSPILAPLVGRGLGALLCGGSRLHCATQSGGDGRRRRYGCESARCPPALLRPPHSTSSPHVRRGEQARRLDCEHDPNVSTCTKVASLRPRPAPRPNSGPRAMLSDIFLARQHERPPSSAHTGEALQAIRLRTRSPTEDPPSINLSLGRAFANSRVFDRKRPSSGFAIAAGTGGPSPSSLASGRRLCQPPRISGRSLPRFDFLAWVAAGSNASAARAPEALPSPTTGPLGLDRSAARARPERHILLGRCRSVFGGSGPARVARPNPCPEPRAKVP